MAGSYKVHIHQGSSRGHSTSSSSSHSSSAAASSSAASTRQSTSSGSRRVYSANGYTSNVVGSSNGALVMNHNQTGYVANSPSPGYGGAYYTR
ncbi:meiotically up-regulated protein [Purpureocillium lavendulum]|uniref:Meiotically up-regulated protein n=1 Tax=Purpureocillium lavendulum TaxID=1247861 RepID=A0AB34FXK8_9HYPO|nr:meiotically up-regulated protein [Purpureocillium lavendulum]